MRKVLLTVLVITMFYTSQGQIPNDTKSDFASQIPLVSNLIGYAKQHLAVRYRPGGTTPKGFDCSGFTRFCFSRFGVRLPHSSAAQGHLGEEVNKESAQPGDLIFFGGHHPGESRIGHVGMITEVTGHRIRFIHSAWSGVRFDYLNASYYDRRFKGIRRVMNRLVQK